ncbi:hypothetical protein DFH09DRAFT_100190 [Mycena vulgaris]|nr:hypothetical protein DFH09DRAFT_100190 [Mycena vulgaris]
MLFKQFKDASQYHRWSTCDEENVNTGPQSTICVRREAIQICLTMPDSGLEYEVDPFEEFLSSWDRSYFRHRAPPKDTQRISAIVATHRYTTPPTVLSQHLDWSQFFAALIPAWAPELTLWKNHQDFFLGSVVTPLDDCSLPFSPVAYIPSSAAVRMKEWTPGIPSKSSPGHPYDLTMDVEWKRFTFSSGSFKAGAASETSVLFSSYIEFDKVHADMLNMSWLSQANMCISLEARSRHQYGVIDTLGCIIWLDHAFEHVLHPDGTAQEAHFFVSPISVRKEGLRVGVEFAQHNHFYWSLNPSGAPILSQEECDSLGIPRLRFPFLRAANCWHDYHYSAIREFFRAKNCDPYSHYVTRLLGLPLVQIEYPIQPNDDVFKS